MSDDPQQTPHPEEKTIARMLAQIGTRVHLIRQDLAKLDGLPEAIERLTANVSELTTTVTTLRTTAGDLGNQVLALTKAVEDITLRSKEVDEDLQAIRGGMRRTNQRLRDLRLVDGAGGEGGLEP